MHSVSRSSSLEFVPLHRSGHVAEDEPAKSYSPAPATLTPLARRVTELTQSVNGKLEKIDELREQDAGAEPLSGFSASLTNAVGRMAENTQKANQAGVDTTRKSFWSKVLGASVAALAVAAVVSLTVATGGAAAVVAGAAIAGVIFAKSLADASCAYKNHQNALAHAAGRPPVHHLPMGSNALGNVFHWIATKCGATPKVAYGVAQAGSWIVRSGLAAAAASCTAGASVAVDSFEHISPMVGAAVTLLQTGLDLKHGQLKADAFAQATRGLEEAHTELTAGLDQLKAYLAGIELPDGSDELKAEIDRLGAEILDLRDAIDELQQNAATTRQLMPNMMQTTAGASGPVLLAGLLLAQSGVDADLSNMGMSSGAVAYASHSGGAASGFVRLPSSDMAPLLDSSGGG